MCVYSVDTMQLQTRRLPLDILLQIKKKTAFAFYTPPISNFNHQLFLHQFLP